MRYRLELEINLPRERVIELFLDPENLSKWQPDLVSFETIGNGDPREVGAKSRQIHRMGNREVESIETITVHNPPEEFAATYEADGVWNLIENRFIEVSESHTKWILQSECKFSNVFMRLLASVAPGMFKKQALTFMEQFKAFAEGQSSGVPSDH